MIARGLFVLLLVLSAVLNVTEGCSCLPSHPQDQFCNADFVIVARVKREWKQDYTKIYKVNIKRAFKMSEKAKIALKSGKIHTPSNGAMCGVNFELEKTYLITGRVYGLQPHVYLCGFVKLWKNVPHRQRKGFRLLYSKGCNCRMSRWTRGQNSDGCAWNPNSVCQTDHGICLKNATGSCNWTRSLAYKKCLYEGQKRDEPPTVHIPDPLRKLENPNEARAESKRVESNKRIDDYYYYGKVKSRRI